MALQRQARLARWAAIGIVVGGGLAVLAACDPPPPPRAFTVDVATDSVDAHLGDGICADAAGHCSLRAAIGENNVLPVSGMTEITLATDVDLSIPRTTLDNDTGDLDITGRVWLFGQGHTVDAHQVDRAIHQHGGDLAMRDLTITGGSVTESAGTGGGILAEGNVVMVSSTVRDNEVTAFGGSGGGIYAAGGSHVVVADSAVDGNSADAQAAKGGGIASKGEVTVVRSSIRSNSTATGAGGGIAVADGRTRVERSTISDNSANQSGGIDVAGGALVMINSTVSSNHSSQVSAIVASGGGTTLQAVTIAENTGLAAVWASTATFSMSGSIIDDASQACIFSPIGSNGHNIASDASCGLTQSSDRQSTDAQLGTLADNGGPTFTHLPGAGSPAIDAVPSGTSELCAGPATVDQRDGRRPAGVGCDIGSVEVGARPAGPLTLVVDTAADAPDASAGDGICDDGSGHCTLRAAIDETNANPSDDVIGIAPGIDPTLTIAGADEDANATGDLDINGSLTIHGGGATLDASSLDRGIHALAGPVSIDHLTVTHGQADENGGGVYAYGSLTLDHVTITDNALVGFDQAGGGLRGFGPTTIVDSTISGNTASQSSGVFLQGTTTIVRSSFTANTSTGWGPTLFLEGAVTIDSSTISGNTAVEVPGLVIQQGSLVLRNSTISDNVATDQSLHLYGSAINNFFDSSITIVGSTVSGNGPGVTIRTGGIETTMSGSIVANGAGQVCDASISSGGWNLASDASCGLALASDHQSVSALLGPLAANGGPTLTRVPGVGSPAIDAIPVGTAGLCDGTPPADQRGVARPQGAACDIGAVEQ